MFAISAERIRLTVLIGGPLTWAVQIDCFVERENVDH